MKALITCLLCLPLLCFAKIQWVEDFDQALQDAKKQKKVVAVYFTGSDWCPWCVKFKDEIISDDAFSQKAEKDFLFVTIDFPHKTLLPAKVLEKNQKLKKDFQIKKFPTVLLLSSEGKVISKMGYQPINGEEYANKLFEIKNEYSEIQEAFFLAQKNWNESMEKYYLRAKNLGAEDLASEILKAGLAKDEGPFFLLEEYTSLLEQNEGDAEKLLRTRKEIEDRDAQNIKGCLRKLAILDFQTLAKNAKTPKDHNQAVEPLLKYIEAFKTQDTQNLWRLEMMVSQYLYSQENVKDALKHARKSYKAAPESMRKEISESIIYLKEQQSPVY